MSRRTFPEWINRNREVDAGGWSCSRMRCLSVSIEVLLGELIRATISGFDVENRTTTSRGRSGAAIVALLSNWFDNTRCSMLALYPLPPQLGLAPVVHSLLYGEMSTSGRAAGGFKRLTKKSSSYLLSLSLSHCNVSVFQIFLTNLNQGRNTRRCKDADRPRCVV